MKRNNDKKGLAADSGFVQNGGRTDRGGKRTMAQTDDLMKQVAANVRAAQGGDAQAFEWLYFQSVNLLRAECRLYLNNEADVEDALQEIYVKIYNSLNGLQDGRAFLGWAKMIARNACINLIRTKERHAGLEDLMGGVSTEDEQGIDTLSAADCRRSIDPEDVAVSGDVSRLVREMLADLPEMQRQCLLLWNDDLTYAQIGKQLGIPEGTAKSNVNYARKKLRLSTEQLEKMSGVKLHSAAPVSVLLALIAKLRLDAAGAPTLTRANYELLQAVKGSGLLQAAQTGGTAAASAAGASASTGAASAAGAGTAAGSAAVSGTAGAAAATGTAAAGGLFGGKIAAIVLAGVIAVGGGTGAAIAISNRNAGEPTTAAAEYTTPAETPAATEAEQTAGEPSAEETAAPTEEDSTTADAEETSGQPAQDAVGPVRIGDAFVFDLPASWQGRVTVTEQPDGAAFYYGDILLLSLKAEAADGQDPWGKALADYAAGDYIVNDILHVTQVAAKAGDSVTTLQAGVFPEMVARESGLLAGLSDGEQQVLLDLMTGGSGLTVEECRRAFEQGAPDIAGPQFAFVSGQILPAIRPADGAAAQPEKEEDAAVYETDDFAFVMPKAWKDTARVEVKDNTIAVFWKDEQVMEIKAYDRADMGGQRVGYTSYGLAVIMVYAADMNDKAVVVSAMNLLVGAAADETMPDADKAELVRIAAGDRYTLEQLNEVTRQAKAGILSDQQVYQLLNEPAVGFLKEEVVPCIREKTGGSQTASPAAAGDRLTKVTEREASGSGEYVAVQEEDGRSITVGGMPGLECEIYVRGADGDTLGSWFWHEGVELEEPAVPENSAYTLMPSEGVWYVRQGTARYIWIAADYTDSGRETRGIAVFRFDGDTPSLWMTLPLRPADTEETAGPDRFLMEDGTGTHAYRLDEQGVPEKLED